MKKAILLTTLALVALAPGFAQQIPRKAPDLTIHYGGTRSGLIGDYRGKVILVMFFLTGCPHCQHTTELLNPIQTDLAKRGFQVVGVAINQDAQQNLDEFKKTYKPTFPVGYADYMDAAAFASFDAAKRIVAPILVFIDWHGMVRFQTSGDDASFFNDKEADNIRAQAQKLLDEPKKGKK